MNVGYSIEKRGNTYRVIISGGFDDKGQRIRHKETLPLGTSKADANRRARDLLVQRDKGVPLQTDRETVGSYLGRWLVAHSARLRPHTLYGYRKNLDRYLVPRLGHHQLARLQPSHIRAMEADLLALGLSGTSVGQIHRILHRALADAVKDGVVARNVVGAVTAPRKSTKEMVTLTPSQLGLLLGASKATRYGNLIFAAAHTGLRRGELVGLKWTDVDLERGTLSVQRSAGRIPGRGLVITEPKTSKGRRQIDVGAELVGVLRAHRARQAEERLAAGPAWRDEGWLFPKPDGTCSDPDVVSHNYHSLVGKLGLPPTRLHDLRHAHATILMEAWTHPKVVQERLGHSSITITLDTYSHVTPTMQREAAGIVENALRQAEQAAS
jgi:integrase